MQKKWIVMLIVILAYNSVFACDLCTVYLGIQPNDYTNSFAVRHRYRLFKSDYVSYPKYTTRLSTQRVGKGEIKDKHAGEPTDNTSWGQPYTYSETYNSYDLIANFYLTNKLQLNGSINFSDNFIKQNDSILANVGGMGDLNILFKYQLFNTSAAKDTMIKNKFIHRVIIGAGASLPTGSYNKSTIKDFVTEFRANTILGSAEMELDPHIQPGTGSMGYLFLVEYLLKYNSVGLNCNASYKIGTTNKNNFRLSNRFNANTSFFMLNKLSSKIKLMPNFGLSYEVSDYDIINGEEYIDSGGEALFLNYGANIFINKIGLAFNYFQPTIENLHGNQPLNNRRFLTQLTYYF